MLLAGGCESAPSAPEDGGVADGSTPDAASLLGVLELCQDAARHCAALYECATEERLLDERSRFGHFDLESCTAMMTTVFSTQCQALADSVAAGTTTVDLGQLASCRDAGAALSCEEYLVAADPLDRCASAPITTGTVASFGDCYWDHECAAPDVCSWNDGENRGYCDVLPERGGVCFGYDGRCAAGLVCDGIHCIDPGSTEGCLVDWECAGDEWCDQPGNDFREDGTDGDPGVCTAPRALGEACDSFSACVAGLYCDDTTGFDPDGWRSPGLCSERGGPGAPCDEPADCISMSCTDAEICE